MAEVLVEFNDVVTAEDGARHVARAVGPLAKPPARQTPQPHFDEPAPDRIEAPPPTDGILNPFSVYRKGETLLRRQLGALSVWHIVNIVRAYGLSDLSSQALNGMSAPDLIELIVSVVRARAESSLAR
jgi:hypothetical protein